MATAVPFEPDLSHASEGTVGNVTLPIHLSAPKSPHHDWWFHEDSPFL